MKSVKPKKKDYCTNLRLPKGLAKIIKQSAEINKRSINSEIEHTLTQKYIFVSQ